MEVAFTPHKTNKKDKKSVSPRTFDFSYFPMDMARLLILPWIALKFRIKHYGDAGSKSTSIKGGAIIVANHTSFDDPLIVAATFWHRRMFYIAAEAVMDIKIRGSLLKGLGCIRIDRNSYDIACIRKCVSVLKAGKALCVFPEGHIETEGHMEAVKPGVILMALQANAAIIPMHIEKRMNAWKRQRITVGEPFMCSDYCSEKMPSTKDIEKITALLYEKCIECDK